jgi:hypothetical protein
MEKQSLAQQMEQHAVTEEVAGMLREVNPQPHALPPDVEQAVVQRNALRKDMRELRAFLTKSLNALGYAYEQMMQCEKMFRDDEEFMAALADMREVLDEAGR